MSDRRPLQRPRLSAHARYRWDSVRNEHQLVFPEGIMILNHTSAAIVKRCDGRTMDDLIRDLRQEYPDQDPIDDVAEFLNTMVQRGLVQDS